MHVRHNENLPNIGKLDRGCYAEAAVLHLTSKGEEVSCPSNDTQDTTAYS